MSSRTPRQIIGDDAFTQLVFEGWEVVPHGRLEAQAKAIEEMREALKKCHAALATLTRPDAIASTTVGAAWAECVAAETAARKALASHSKGGE